MTKERLSESRFGRATKVEAEGSRKLVAVGGRATGGSEIDLGYGISRGEWSVVGCVSCVLYLQLRMRGEDPPRPVVKKYLVGVGSGCSN